VHKRKVWGIKNPGFIHNLKERSVAGQIDVLKSINKVGIYINTNTNEI